MKERPGMTLQRETPAGELLLVNKPKDWTSFDVVNKIRHASGIRKVGHAGTLDPLATGLLLVCTGTRTRELSSFVGLDKDYRVTMRLGERTSSFDAATPVNERRSIEGITPARITETLSSFVGIQQQKPPMWSAVKVRGRRLYDYARQGREVEREERTVEISNITILDTLLPDVVFEMTCSKGTYVRALVEDFGLRLGCGAHVTTLERSRIGPFRLADAWQLDALVQVLAQRGERAA
jgi:tRNA pseudouridine55 synthase